MGFVGELFVYSIPDGSSLGYSNTFSFTCDHLSIGVASFVSTKIDMCLSNTFT